MHRFHFLDDYLHMLSILDLLHEGLNFQIIPRCHQPLYRSGSYRITLKVYQAVLEGIDDLRGCKARRSWWPDSLLPRL